MNDLDMLISKEDIKQAILREKECKAVGMHMLLAEFLKSAVHTVAPFLAKLFNHKFEHGIYLVIVPLLKKWDPKNLRITEVFPY